MDKIPASDLAELFLKGTPLIDVRAPVEFAQGSLPGAINLPIMNDDERAAVGTAYKQQGREPAIKLGHDLVSGPVKEQRLQLWTEHIRKHPETVIYCFRGGLRSQITQRWLAETGIRRPLIEGGYKKARQFLIDQTDAFARTKKMLILSGPTGSAKTHLLKQARPFFPSVDLEALACHRGSAFGGMSAPQPSQIDFENSLSLELLKLSSQSTLLVEDESRMIGKRTVPESFFLQMRDSELIYVDESFEQRVDNIFQDYIIQTAIGRGYSESAQTQFSDYKKSLAQITRKLGGLRAQEILQDILAAEEAFKRDSRDLNLNKVWISKLLQSYYDPLYASSFAKRQPKIAFRGDSKSVLEFIKNKR